MKTKVYLGSGYSKAKIVNNRKDIPYGNIKLRSNKRFTVYVRGAETFVVPKKNIKLIHE